MQLEKLLADATKSAPSASQRSKEITLAQMLNDRHGGGAITEKGVAKWFERGSIPGKWLLRIAALGNPPLNLSNYV